MVKLFFEKFSANKSEIIVFFGGQIFTVLLNFAIIKLIAQGGAEVYGEYILITTAAAFAGQLFYGPFQQGFIRQYYEAGNAGNLGLYHRLISAFQLTGLILFLLLGGLFLLGSVILSGTGYVTLILLALLFALTSKFSEFFGGLLNVARKREKNAVLQVTERALSLLLLYFLLTYSAMKTEYIIPVLAVPLLIVGLIKARGFGWKYEKFSFRESLNSPAGKSLIRYSLPFILWGVAIWLQLNGEKWVISGFLTTADVGYYGLMFSLTNAFIALPSNLTNDLFLPLIFKNFSVDQGDKKRGEFYIILSFLVVLALTAGTVILFYFAGDFLITVLGNASYTKYSPLLPWLALGSGLFYAGQALCSKGLAYNKPEIYLFPKMFAGVLSIILYYLFIQFYGMTGIIAAVALTGLIYLMMIFIVNRRISA